MPKQVWLPGAWGGQKGGGQRAELRNCSIQRTSEGFVIAPTPEFISRTKDLGRSEVTRQVSGLSDLYKEPVCVPSMPEEAPADGNLLGWPLLIAALALCGLALVALGVS